jgi:hypothetical protein
MSDTQKVTEDLQQQIEFQAGAAIVGPDAGQLQFTFDGQTKYPLNYLAVMLGGFATSDELITQMQRFTMAREFMILGNPVRLQRVWPVAGAGPSAVEGIPQGPILVWRHQPTVTFEDGVWSAEITYAVLPPFARLAA